MTETNTINAACPKCGNTECYLWLRAHKDQRAQCKKCLKNFDPDLDYSKMPDLTVIFTRLKKYKSSHKNVTVTRSFLNDNGLNGHLLKFENGRIIFNESVGVNRYKKEGAGFRINSLNMCQEIIEFVFGNVPPPERSLYFKLIKDRGNAFALKIIEPDANSKRYG